MANTRGVFTLQDVRYAQEDNVWVSPDQAFASNITTSPNVGYYAGATTPSEVSSIDKCNFSSDTTALLPSANLSTVRSTHGATNSLQAAYFGGGRTPIMSRMDKLTYSIDTVAYIPSANLSVARQDPVASGSFSQGYWAGGYNGSSYVTTVDKCIYATDTTFRFPSANLVTARNIAAITGTQSLGLIGGGYSGSAYLSSFEKITYSTDTIGSSSAQLTVARGAVTATGNSTAGYYGGGGSSGPTFYSRMDKLTYSGETVSYVPGANLSTSAQNTGASGNQTAGYFGGGYPVRSTMDKVTYSSDTTAAVPGAALSATRYNFGATGPRENALPETGYIASTQNLKGDSTFDTGYYSGGYEPAHVSTTDKTFYSSDTTGRVPAADMPVTSGGCAPISSNNNGYYSGGYSAPTTQSSLKKLSFTTETNTIIPGGALSASKYALGAAETRTRGYVVGGSAVPVSNYSTVERMDFAVETFSILPGSTLSANRRYSQGSSGPDFGYFTGGYEGGPVSTVDKLSFATETAFRSPSTFSSARSALAAISNGVDASYVGGGYPAPNTISTISKLSYATDSIGDLPSVLSSARYQLGTTGNSTQGYFAGGSPVPVSNQSSVDKFNFASDTCVQIPSSSLSAPRRVLQGTSSQKNSLPRPKAPTPTLDVSYTQITTPFTGYTAGGGGPAGKTSNYYKLLYATETGSFLPSTNLTSSRGTYLCGYSNTEKGYTAGGYTGPPAYTSESWVDRNTYSTDTSVTVPGAYLPGAGRYGGTSGSSPSAGYYVAGYSGSAFNSTLKMPFSSETHSTLPSSANLSSARYYFCGGGGPDKGYFGGGYPTTTNMDKLIYSTDTMTASPSTNLFGASDSTTRGTGAIVSNSRDAYLATGQNPGSPAPVPNYGYKINFSTDTSRIISGIVAQPRQSVAGAFGHELQGYFCGGIVPSPYATVTIVDKITYATEVSQLVPTAYMPEDRAGGSSMSARNFGASGGGTSNIL